MSIPHIFNKLRPFFFILVFTFLINLLFGSGLHLSLSLTYKFLLIIAFFTFTHYNHRPKVLASVILAPFKGGHAANLRIVFMVAIEFIPVLIDEVKSTAKDLGALPEYQTRKYMILFFKPELYLVPLIEGIVSKSELVAKRVEDGEYASPPINKPNTREILLALAGLILAVKYAL